MQTRITSFLVLGSALSLSQAAGAQDAGGSVSLGDDGMGASGDSDLGDSGGGEAKDHPFEIGLFGGVFFPSEKHSLRNDDESFREFDSVTPDVGLRLGILPLPFFGVEGEAAAMPTETEDATGAFLYTLRANLILQYPNDYVIPFLVAGGGFLGSESETLGRDADGLVDFGIGAKVPITNQFLARVDLRDNMSNHRPGGTYPHHLEAVVGLSFAFGGKPPPPPPEPAPVDTDGDGIFDPDDKCPEIPADTPDGCPIPDTDGDGVLDPDDECPEEAGTLPNGCPDLDPDGDGIPVPDDKCPEEAGIAPDGCPDPDPDKDGITGDADKCPQEPETVNGFEDDDGCPDEVPDSVKEFSGVIQGIEFDLGKSTIRAQSFALLDRAAGVLTEHPSLRLEITGHTDSTGSADRNRVLSADRAAAVKLYLVNKGIDAERLTTRGAGPDEPIADNSSREGRQRNRRIEFKVLR